MKNVVLFKDKKDCCACGACVNACPQNAIAMVEDNLGFLYPEINYELCIGCGACKRVCSFQNIEEDNTPLKTFAAVSANPEQRKDSSSGGIFPALAEKIIIDGGVVFGSAYDNSWCVAQTAVENTEDLKKLQGSKYVFSTTGDTFKNVKECLEKGRSVLYSGVPCQIAGLYGYLGKGYENLYTVDIVCHGVPNLKMFSDFIRSLERKYRGKLTRFTFRDKSLGWGKNGSAEITADGARRKIKLWSSANPYFYYFDKAVICRENCYSCKYAGKNRPADITLGDFWGIEKQHPKYLGKNAWDENGGISLVVCNTEKGTRLLADLEGIELRESEFKRAAEANPQLREPSKRGDRDDIMKIYSEGGWSALENRYNSEIGLKRYSSRIKAVLPASLKRALKRFK